MFGVGRGCGVAMGRQVGVDLMMVWWMRVSLTIGGGTGTRWTGHIVEVCLMLKKRAWLV